jgi:DNA replication protein DnaC
MDYQSTIVPNLRRLRLPGMADNLSVRLQEAQDRQLGYQEFLHLLVGDEIANRESNNFEKRIRLARFAEDCTFATFDFHFNADQLPPATLRDLATCGFVRQRQNLVLAGPPGIGKSYIAQALGHEACKRGFEVLFAKVHKLLALLQDELHPRRSQTLLDRARTVDLLILDDFGFRAYTQDEAELLYTIADERLAKRSTIITSNRPPEDWYSVFQDPVTGGAILDRLVSGAVKLMTTKGRSYRKEGRKAPPPAGLDSAPTPDR